MPALPLQGWCGDAETRTCWLCARAFDQSNPPCSHYGARPGKQQVEQALLHTLLCCRMCGAGTRSRQCGGAVTAAAMRGVHARRWTAAWWLGAGTQAPRGPSAHGRAHRRQLSSGVRRTTRATSGTPNLSRTRAPACCSDTTTIAQEPSLCRLLQRQCTQWCIHQNQIRIHLCGT